MAFSILMLQRQSTKPLLLSDRSFTFWRFMIQIPLGPCEMKVMYNINNGPPTDFWVPALGQNMRWAAYSVSPENP